eukprot:COSAG01_NODE_20231_length_964_cov_1.728324_2_plen_213_part_00
MSENPVPKRVVTWRRDTPRVDMGDYGNKHTLGIHSPLSLNLTHSHTHTPHTTLRVAAVYAASILAAAAPAAATRAAAASQWPHCHRTHGAPAALCVHQGLGLSSRGGKPTPPRQHCGQSPASAPSQTWKHTHCCPRYHAPTEPPTEPPDCTRPPQTAPYRTKPYQTTDRSAPSRPEPTGPQLLLSGPAESHGGVKPPRVGPGRARCNTSGPA